MQTLPMCQFVFCWSWNQNIMNAKGLFYSDEKVGHIPLTNRYIIHLLRTEIRWLFPTATFYPAWRDCLFKAPKRPNFQSAQTRFVSAFFLFSPPPPQQYNSSPSTHHRLHGKSIGFHKNLLSCVVVWLPSSKSGNWTLTLGTLRLSLFPGP